MIKNKKCISILILALIGLLASISLARPNLDKQHALIASPILVTEDRPVFMDGRPEEHLMDALLYYEIEHPEIVYAQAIHETGNFKSKGCTQKNNLFGLMKGKSLRTFGHWTESIVFYKEKIQSRYKGGDYYSFLKRIRYAEDRNYNDRLRKIVRQNKSGHNHTIDGNSTQNPKRVSTPRTVKKKSGTKRKRSKRTVRKTHR